MDYIKAIDAYEVPINLAFRNYQGGYKTAIGGCVSFILSCLIFVIFINNADRWYNHKSPNVVMYSGSTPRASGFENYTYAKLDYIPFIGV